MDLASLGPIQLVGRRVLPSSKVPEVRQPDHGCASQPREPIGASLWHCPLGLDLERVRRQMLPLPAGDRRPRCPIGTLRASPVSAARPAIPLFSRDLAERLVAALHNTFAAEVSMVASLSMPVLIPLTSRLPTASRSPRRCRAESSSDADLSAASVLLMGSGSTATRPLKACLASRFEMSRTWPSPGRLLSTDGYRPSHRRRPS